MRFAFWKKPQPAPFVTGYPPTPRDLEDMLLDWLRNLPQGERRAIRCDAGWTQAEVAAHCGVQTWGQVAKWERGGGWTRRSGLRYAALLKELEVMRDDAVVTDERSTV